MNERKQWKANYKELSQQIREQKQKFKEADRAFQKISHQNNINLISRNYSLQADVRTADNVYWQARCKLGELRSAAIGMMHDLGRIKEEARAAWEANHVQ